MVQLGPGHECGCGQAQRQGVAPGQPVDALEVIAGDTVLAQQRLGIVARQVTKRQAAEELTHRRRPARHRRLATCEDDADGVALCRDERLLEPQVQRPKDLIAVEGEDHALPQAREPSRGFVDGRSDRYRWPLTVHARKPWAVGSIAPQSRRSMIAPRLRASRAERLEKAGLADPADAVDEHDQRALPAQEKVEECALGLAPHEARALGFDPLSDSDGHDIPLPEHALVVNDLEMTRETKEAGSTSSQLLSTPGLNRRRCPGERCP